VKAAATSGAGFWMENAGTMGNYTESTTSTTPVCPLWLLLGSGRERRRGMHGGPGGGRALRINLLADSQIGPGKGGFVECLGADGSTWVLVEGAIPRQRRGWRVVSAGEPRARRRRMLAEASVTGGRNEGRACGKAAQKRAGLMRRACYEVFRIGMGWAIAMDGKLPLVM